MRKTIYIIILIFAMSANALYASVEGFVEISSPDKMYPLKGEWFFKYGDNMDWASSDIDISEWDLCEMPSWIGKEKKAPVPGFYWYKLIFRVDKNKFGDRPLFISLPRIFHAYEAYLNGRPIGSRGKLPGPGGSWQWGVGGLYYIAMPGQLYADSNVLAVRAYAGHTLFAGSMYNYGYMGAYNFRKSFFWISNIINLLLGLLVLISALYNFNYNFKHSNDQSYFHFSAYSVFLGFFIILVWLPDTTENPDTRMIHIAQTLSLILSFVFLSFFVRRFFHLRIGGLSKFFDVLAALGFAASAMILFTGYFPVINVSLYGALFIFLVLYIIIAYLVITEIRKGMGFFFPALAGIAIALAGEAIDFMQIIGIDLITLPVYLWVLTPLGFVIFNLMFSYSLIRIEAVKIKDEKDRAEPPKEERSYLGNVDLERLKTGISLLLTDDKIFLDENISLKKMADKLEITPHQLSEYLNDYMKLNFKTLINNSRVEEAKKIISDDPGSSVISVAFSVGFNSLSTFYEAFKKSTGVSPGQYKKSV